MNVTKKIKLKYRPGDKMNGAGAWLSGETYYKFMNDFLKSPLNFLLKGSPIKANLNPAIIIPLSPEDRIGYVKDFTNREITVDLNSSNIYKGLLELIMQDKLLASPILMITKKDQYTQEILEGKIIAFELTC